MPYTPKDNSGALFTNSRKEQSNHPDYTGSAMIGGVEYYMDAWVNTSQNGTPYFGFKFKAKNGDSSGVRTVAGAAPPPPGGMAAPQPVAAPVPQAPAPPVPQPPAQPAPPQAPVAAPPAPAGFPAPGGFPQQQPQQTADQAFNNQLNNWSGSAADDDIPF